MSRSAPPVTVLVVDDDPDVRDVMSDAVATLGCDVQQAGSGDAALALFVRAPCPVVVTDVRMPRVDGVMLLKAVRAANPATQVVMITAHADVASATEAVRHGAFDYVLKPFELDALRVCVQRALDCHRVLASRDAHLAELRRINDTLRATQAQLLDRERLAVVQQLVAGLHHAILNPLAGLAGAIEALKHDALPLGHRAETFCEAEQQVRRIEGVVRGLDRLRGTTTTRYVGDITMLDLDTVAETRGRRVS